MMTDKCYCRTCFTTENLSPIFGDEKTSECRSKELFLVTGVVIEQADNLSHLICNYCNNVLNESLKLRSQSQATDTLLKNIKNVEKCLKTNNSKMEKQKQNYVDTEKIAELIKGVVNNKVIDITISKQNKEDNNKTNNKKKNNQKTIVETNECSNNRKKSLRIQKKVYFEDTNTKIIDLNKEKQIENMVKKDFKKDYDDTSENISTDSINSNMNVKFDDKNIKVKHKRKRLTKEQVAQYMRLAVQPVAKAGPVRCGLCGVELRERRFFISHAKTHFAAEHVCECCGKRFRSRHSLAQHRQRLHGAARRLVCDDCPYRAVDKAALQNHSRAVHTGERPFTCDVCGDTFRVRATLVQHMRTHFAAYDVQCEKCPALFRSRSELASHRNKVHLMTYTYYCYLCPGSYKAVGTVKNHIVKVHGVPRDQHPPIKCTKIRRPSNTEVEKKREGIE